MTSPTSSPRLLAFETSTDTLSVGVRHGQRQWLYSGEGAARSSATLIPTLLDLLAQAGLCLQELDAIVFGRGPGSFTGVRTACAVAQGLAAGSGRPVLPIDTLLALAEQGREQAPRAADWPVTAVLDARMNEVYVQHFDTVGGDLIARGPCQLLAPRDLSYPDPAPRLVTGNAGAVYPDLRPAPEGSVHQPALPSAQALLRLACSRLHLTMPAAQALPLYVRDKVAQTTEERLAAKAAVQPAGAA